MIDLSDGVPGVSAPDPENFEEFWPYYLSQHLHPKTRAVHAVGTLAAVTTGISGLLRRKPTTLLWAPLLAYVPAFASHYIFEKNQPATLGGHVLWSIGGDFRMLAHTLTGSIQADVDEIREALDMSPDEVTLADRADREETWPLQVNSRAVQPQEV
jgi:hypothetical protein